MKKAFVSLALATAVALSFATDAAAQDSHQPSPLAKVMQRVGVHDVTITFSRPGVKDRVIWGELVPYDEYWRAGANASTTIEFGADAKVGGKDVPAGTYALMILPKKDSWEMVLSSDTGTNGRYPGEDKDVVRVTVTPEDAPHQERLLYSVEDLVDDAPTATIVLHWEKKKAELPIELAAE